MCIYICTHTCVCVCMYVNMNIHMFWGKSLGFWLCLMLVTTAEMKASEVQGWLLT